MRRAFTLQVWGVHEADRIELREYIAPPDFDPSAAGAGVGVAGFKMERSFRWVDRRTDEPLSRDYQDKSVAWRERHKAIKARRQGATYASAQEVEEYQVASGSKIVVTAGDEIHAGDAVTREGTVIGVAAHDAKAGEELVIILEQP